MTLTMVLITMLCYPLILPVDSRQPSLGLQFKK